MTIKTDSFKLKLRHKTKDLKAPIIPGEMSWKSDFHIVYCKGPMYFDVGKSSYVRLVS